MKHMAFAHAPCAFLLVLLSACGGGSTVPRQSFLAPLFGHLDITCCIHLKLSIGDLT